MTIMVKIFYRNSTYFVFDLLFVLKQVILLPCNCFDKVSSRTCGR